MQSKATQMTTIKPRAEYYLAQRKWTKFLLAVPAGKPRGYHLENANDLASIKVTAALINRDPSRGRRLSLTIDYDTKVVTVTVTEI